MSSYWRKVVDLNEYQKNRFAKRITRALYNTLAHKRVAVLGWAYKKNTGDTRESAAITVVGALLHERAEVAVYDPQVSEEQIYRDIEAEHPNARQRVTVHTDAVSACSDASAIVILTEWDEFKTNQIPGARMQLEDSRKNIGFSISSVDSAVDMQDTAAVAPSDNDSDAHDSVHEKEDTSQKRVDWYQIAASMRRPRLVFDGRNVVEPEKLASLGFRVECIGKAGAC